MILNAFKNIRSIKMSKKLFITATKTDAGKTYVTALILKKLIQSKINAGYYKAALSGAKYKNGILSAGDAEYVKKTANIDADISEMVSYVYENAVSPHLAAKIEGNPLEMEKVKNDFDAVCRKYNYVVAEGSGGIVCPIRIDDKEIWLTDIIKELNFKTVIVVPAGLGSINNSILTVEYMRNLNIEIKGIFLNFYHFNSIMENDNKLMIEKYTGIPVIACIPPNAYEIDTDIKNILSLFDD